MQQLWRSRYDAALAEAFTPKTDGVPDALLAAIVLGVMGYGMAGGNATTHAESDIMNY